MELEQHSRTMASREDSSPPQAGTEPPSKEQILAIAQSAVANLQESLQKQLKTEGVDEETKNAVAKSLNYTCDVYLANLNLSELPEELTDILRQGVTRITFAHNHLTGIPSLSSGFADCHSLKYLVLRSNELTDFPQACFSLPNLELLDLKKNQIESLPEDLDRMTRLRVLSVVRNKIQKLPVCIGQMKGLHQFATRRNPITFPPKEYWAIDNTAEEEGKSEDKSNDREKNRDMAETAKIKKLLQDYQTQVRERANRDGESEMSESNVETPRPARRKTSGRFPIKPSVSGIEYSTESIPASPMLPKAPPLPSKSYARPGNQPLGLISRPGVAPLITSNERNRSNSESQMPTSVREKRMGIIPRKSTEAEKLDIRKRNRLSHLRGLSHGSALQSSSVPPVSDSSSPTSPTEGDFEKPVFLRRLSSLPEGKRKSRFEHPHVELARGLYYSLNQIYGPIKDLIKVLRGGSSKRTSIERTYYNAYSFMEELGTKLAKLESREEDSEEDEKRHSTASIHDCCSACIKTFEQLSFSLRKNFKPLISQSNPQLVRTLMHLLYASLIEVRNSCLKLRDVESRPTTADESREFDRGRQSSLSHRRPVTSHRIRDQQGSQVSLGAPMGMPDIQKQPAFGQMSRTNNQISQSPTSFRSRSMEQNIHYGLANPSLPRTNIYDSLDEDESQHLQFEQIWFKLNASTDLAMVALPSCATALSNARIFANSKSMESEVGAYDMLLDRCKRVRDGVEGLKRRLSAFSTKEPAFNGHRDLWPSVTIFTREYFIFAENIKEVSNSTSTFPYEIRALLKPVHAAVKDISHAITNSPWAHLALTHPQAQKSPYQPPFTSSHMYNQGQGAQSTHQQLPHPQHPPLSLQTRGHIPPASSSDPVSATSIVSSNGNSAVSSGHVTPLPATPMSAALGPAALATMPMIPDLPISTQPLGAAFLANGNTTAGGTQPAPSTGNVERSRSASQRSRDWLSDQLF